MWFVHRDTEPSIAMPCISGAPKILDWKNFKSQRAVHLWEYQTTTNVSENLY